MTIFEQYVSRNILIYYLMKHAGTPCSAHTRAWFPILKSDRYFSGTSYADLEKMKNICK
jgi:hypothetical protein